MKRIGIFGASECGKTTLAKEISREYWRLHRVPSLVLVMFPESWGPQAWVTTDAEKFKAAVWGRRGNLVIVEDASSTLNRDKDFKPFFTCIRHAKHDFIVIGHSGSDLLPAMRQQLTEVFFFAQTEISIRLWQQDLPGITGLEQAIGLPKYHFLHAKNFEPAVRKTLKR